MVVKNKARFDMRVQPSRLELGDRVLVRAVRLRDKRELADRWETDIYVVVEQAGDLPVYTSLKTKMDHGTQSIVTFFYLADSLVPQKRIPPHRIMSANLKHASPLSKLKNVMNLLA